MRRIFCVLIFGFFAFSLTSCGFFYGNKKNVAKDGYLYIYPNVTYDEVLDSLANVLIDVKQFDSYAQSEGLDTKIKPGKYKVSKDDTNESLVRRLLLGEQEDVRVMIANPPTLFHMARDASKGLLTDSTAIIEAIQTNSTFMEKGLDLETAKMYFIPNTYFYKWTSTGDEFVERMITEHDKFWTAERQQKLEASNMSELEVYTLASIVQLEAPKADEQAKVARAYLNRLNIGMKLDADPTSIYAWKLKNGFSESIQRVLHKHVNMASEYNTYQIAGLPPAPICLPNPSAIDAVLSPAEHEFIYFCADPDRPGYHSFTSNYAEHQQNAAKYQKWLKENNIN